MDTCDAVGLGFFQKSGRLRMLMVKVGGWVSILKLLTDAYVRMGGWVRIFQIAYECLSKGVSGWVW